MKYNFDSVIENGIFDCESVEKVFLLTPHASAMPVTALTGA